MYVIYASALTVDFHYPKQSKFCGPDPFINYKLVKISMENAKEYLLLYNRRLRNVTSSDKFSIVFFFCFNQCHVALYNSRNVNIKRKELNKLITKNHEDDDASVKPPGLKKMVGVARWNLL